MVAGRGGRRENVLASTCEYPPFHYAPFIPANEGLMTAGKLLPREMCRKASKIIFDTFSTIFDVCDVALCENC